MSNSLRGVCVDFFRAGIIISRSRVVAHTDFLHLYGRCRFVLSYIITAAWVCVTCLLLD